MTAGELAGKRIDLRLATMKHNALQSHLREELERAEPEFKSFLASRSTQDRTKYEDRLAYIAEIRSQIVKVANTTSSLTAELKDRQDDA